MQIDAIVGDREAINSHCDRSPASGDSARKNFSVVELTVISEENLNVTVQQMRVVSAWTTT
jgi:hypothetical protein